MSSSVKVIVALAAGAAAGLLIRQSASPFLLAVVDLLDPIASLWVNAIRMTVIPLVVSLIVGSVATAAGMTDLKALGVRAIVVFAGLMALSVLVGVTVVPALYDWLPIEDPGGLLRAGAAPVAAATDSGFAAWLTSLVPVNPVKAAADGAMLPLTVFALAFAVALQTVEPQRRESVLTFFRGIADALLAIIHVVIVFAPVGVFILILHVVVRTGVSAASALGSYVLIAAIAQAVLVALLYPVVLLASRFTPREFAQAALPAQAVAVSTTSSLAALPAMIEGAGRQLGIPVIGGVVLPMAVSVFKITRPTIWPVAIVFLSHLYGVPLSAGQLLTTALLGVAGGLSAPGIPHGWLLAVAPVAASMHLPAEGIGLLIAVDTIPDVFATLGNVTGDLAAAALVAGRRQPDVTA
jgi:proton glutamate symport protein